MSQDGQNDEDTNLWWDDSNIRAHKEEWSHATDDYIEEYELDVEVTDFNEVLLKKMLKFIGRRDAR